MIVVHRTTEFLLSASIASIVYSLVMRLFLSKVNSSRLRLLHSKVDIASIHEDGVRCGVGVYLLQEKRNIMFNVV